MYPGVIGMSILFTSIFSAVSIIWDREFGFLKEVLVAPVPRWAVALGKAFGGATIAIVQATILILIAPIIGIHLSPGIIVEMWIMAFLIGVALTSLGIAIAARMSSMQGFQMIINFLIMPLYFLSGAMFPLSSAPAWIKALMTVNPLTYFVDGLRNILFSETKMGNGALVGRTVVEVATRAGLIRWSLIFDLAVVSLVAVVLTAAGAYRFSNQAE
jgi:ABC-2 type transport system permease protein